MQAMVVRLDVLVIVTIEDGLQRRLSILVSPGRGGEYDMRAVSST